MIPHVNPGDRIELSASRMNAYTDAANAYRAIVNNQDALSLEGSIELHNNTEFDKAAHSIFSIDGVSADPNTNARNLDSFKSRPVLTGGAITSATKSIAISTVGLRPGAVGDAVVSGPVQCKINITSTSHRYAEWVTGDSEKLKSAETGEIKIIWQPGSTGTQWCMVSIGASYVMEPDYPQLAEVTTAPGGGEVGVTLIDYDGSFSGSGFFVKELQP